MELSVMTLCDVPRPRRAAGPQMLLKSLLATVLLLLVPAMRTPCDTCLKSHASMITPLLLWMATAAVDMDDSSEALLPVSEKLSPLMAMLYASEILIRSNAPATTTPWPSNPGGGWK